MSSKAVRPLHSGNHTCHLQLQVSAVAFSFQANSGSLKNNVVKSIPSLQMQNPPWEGRGPFTGLSRAPWPEQEEAMSEKAAGLGVFHLQSTLKVSFFRAECAGGWRGPLNTSGGTGLAVLTNRLLHVYLLPLLLFCHSFFFLSWGRVCFPLSQGPVLWGPGRAQLRGWPPRLLMAFLATSLYAATLCPALLDEMKKLPFVSHLLLRSSGS